MVVIVANDFYNKIQLFGGNFVSHLGVLIPNKCELVIATNASFGMR